jgi:uncharacterized protein YcaQ
MPDNHNGCTIRLKSTSKIDQNYEVVVTSDIARDLAVIKQGLNKRPVLNDKETILEVIKKIKMLQLDTINVVERSHYLVILSRIGNYKKRNLDELLHPDKVLFEQWSHADCLIPIEFYPFYLPQILNRRNLPMKYGRLKRLGENPQNTLGRVLKTVETEGPLSSKDFTDNGHEKRTWWNRKPSRVALEVLWHRGYLAVQRRENFQCFYDLTDRVIPCNPLEEDTLEDFKRWSTISSLDALGIGTVADVADYYRQKTSETRALLEKLADDGTVARIKVREWKEDGYALFKDLKLINELKVGTHRFERLTFLSPFDNLIWSRNRSERLFGFHFRVEMYTPKEKRTYGYYSMPILYGNRIVGIIDPKADRKRKTLIINAIYLKKGFERDDNFLNELSKGLDEFMNFNGCVSITVSPRGFAGKLGDLNGITR